MILKNNLKVLNGILYIVGYTSYCADVYCYDFTSTGGDANMQTLVNSASASSFKKGQSCVGMRFLPKILESLKDYPKSVQIKVIHLLYFALFTSMVATVATTVCVIVLRH